MIYYIIQNNMQHACMKQKLLQVETAVLMGANRATAQREMMDALNFEIELAKSIYRPDDKDSRGSSYYNPVTIADLDRHYPTIPWVDLFQRLLPNKVF
jgi:membrane metallo-endopeptidase-like protein 1